MAPVTPQRPHDDMRSQVLYTAAKLFLESGYTDTTLRGIAAAADINIGSLMNQFKTKEDILCELVDYVIESQFKAANKLLQGITEDKILFYAAETTLQLHIAESSENLRDLYAAAYSLPKSSGVIRHAVTSKLEGIFGEHLPEHKTQDFFKLEIASGGIMRGFLTIPCDMWFTMDQKVAAFLETCLLVYRVPNDKIGEAIAFVARFDYPVVARQTVDSMMTYLKKRIS